jgi:type IV pilus assembly protein PilF
MTVRFLCATAVAAWLAACAPVETKRPTQAPLTPAQINVHLGLQHWRNYQPRLALDRITQALAQDPNLASAHNVAGLIYERLGSPGLAAKHLKRALALAPQDPSALNNYGKLLCTQGRLARAEQYFLRAADNPRNPSPEVAYTNAGLCARRIPDLDRAAQYFTAALNLNPMMPTASFQLARISFEKARYPEARRDLQQYLQIARHTAESLWLAVQIERALGNSARERQYARRLEVMFPHSEEAQALFQSKLRPAYQRIPPPRPVPSSAGAVTVTATTGNDDAFLRDAWVRAQAPEDYTIEIFASHNELAMPYFRDEYKLSGELAYYATRRDDARWYALLWGKFEDKRQAHNAISQLPAELRASAQVRRFADAQREIQEWEAL